MNVKTREIPIRFDIGDRVWIDDDRELVGFVTAIVIRHHGISYEVSYMHAGEAKCPFIESYRLTEAAR